MADLVVGVELVDRERVDRHCEIADLLRSSSSRNTSLAVSVTRLNEQSHSEDVAQSVRNAAYSAQFITSLKCRPGRSRRRRPIRPAEPSSHRLNPGCFAASTRRLVVGSIPARRGEPGVVADDVVDVVRPSSRLVSLAASAR